MMLTGSDEVDNGHDFDKIVCDSEVSNLKR